MDKYIKAFREAVEKLEEVRVGKELIFSRADGIMVHIMILIPMKQ